VSAVSNREPCATTHTHRSRKSVVERISGTRNRAVGVSSGLSRPTTGWGAVATRSVPGPDLADASFGRDVNEVRATGAVNGPASDPAADERASDDSEAEPAALVGGAGSAAALPPFVDEPLADVVGSGLSFALPAVAGFAAVDGPEPAASDPAAGCGALSSRAPDTAPAGFGPASTGPPDAGPSEVEPAFGEAFGPAAAEPVAPDFEVPCFAAAAPVCSPETTAPRPSDSSGVLVLSSFTR